jgi:two-component SAPR family response regulator
MTEKILMVDNDIKSIRSFKKILEESYFVSYYENAAEAIKDMDEGLEYDLAIFDVTIKSQRVDCEELVNTSRMINPDVPIMTLSAWTYVSPYVQKNLYKDYSPEHIKTIINDYFKINSHKKSK